MKKFLLAAASALALMAPAYAADNASDEPGSNEASRAIEQGASQTADTLGRIWDGATNFRAETEVYAQGAFAAEQMTGLRVAGSGSDNIATVHDLIIAADGSLEAVILSDGGIAGAAPRLVSLPAASVQRNMVENQLHHLTIRESADSLKAHREYLAELKAGQTGVDTKEASPFSAEELIGAAVDDESGKRIAAVQDVVFSSDGKNAKVVLSVGGIADIGDKDVAIDFNDLLIAEGDGGLYVKTSNAEIESAPVITPRGVETPEGKPAPAENE